VDQNANLHLRPAAPASRRVASAWKKDQTGLPADTACLSPRLVANTARCSRPLLRPRRAAGTQSTSAGRTAHPRHRQRQTPWHDRAPLRFHGVGAPPISSRRRPGACATDELVDGRADDRLQSFGGSEHGRLRSVERDCRRVQSRTNAWFQRLAGSASGPQLDRYAHSLPASRTWFLRPMHMG
jgi:hypothetical protein